MANGYNYAPDFSPLLQGLQLYGSGVRQAQQADRQAAADARAAELHGLQLQGLQQAQAYRESEQQRQQETIGRERDYYQAISEIEDFTDQSKLAEINKQFPRFYEHTQKLAQDQKLLRESGAADFSGRVYQALERGDLATAEAITRTPEIQELMKFTGQQGFDADSFVELMKNDPEQAKRMALDTFRFSGGDLTRLGIKDPAKIGKTAAVSNYEYYQELKKQDAEGAEQFGRKAGFISREGQELSGHMSRRLSEVNDLAAESEKNASRFETLANDFDKANVGGGLFQGKWGESFKQFAGTEDAVSELRRKYNAVRSSLVVKNLPPGAASDTDIALALSGFPDEKATGATISSFLRGMAKIEKEAARFNSFRSDFISEHGTERTKDGKSMFSVWKELRKQEDIAQRQAEADRKAEAAETAETAAEQPPAAPEADPELQQLSIEELMQIAYSQQGAAPAPRPLNQIEQAQQAAYAPRR